MEFVARLLSACSSIQKVGANPAGDEAASEVQLNAFEFRNYRTTLEATQHKLVERIVNQWCASLVKGKTLKVNGSSAKVLMDKDLLGLMHGKEYYPLKEMIRLEMFRDPEESLQNVPFAMEIMFRLKVPLTETKRAVVGEFPLKFNFELDLQRLNFTLSLRVLRTRDPTLDTSATLEVLVRDEDDLDDGLGLNKIANTYHYSVEAGIPVVFSVSELQIFREIQSTSRLVYLEFFVRYPRQDKFLYAKSPTTPLPQKILATEDAALRRKREKKNQDEEQENRRERDAKAAEASAETAKESMTFDLKNVKLKTPKVPHTIFGRLMAKDDYFPTAIGTFDFDIKKSYLQDRRREYRRDDNGRKEPETLQIPMMSTWKMPGKSGKQEFVKIAVLTIRVMGYIVDREDNDNRRNTPENEENEVNETQQDLDEGQEEEEDLDDEEFSEEEDDDAPASP